jgi:hypothetical protein
MAKKRHKIRGTTPNPEAQLLELYRTLRDDPDAAAKIVATMEPDEVKRIRELWLTMRKATKKRRPRRG